MVETEREIVDSDSDPDSVTSRVEQSSGTVEAVSRFRKSGLSATHRSARTILLERGNRTVTGYEPAAGHALASLLLLLLLLLITDTGRS